MNKKQTTRPGPAHLAPAWREERLIRFDQSIAEPRRYERQIERLHQRYLLSSRLYELRQDEVSLASIVMNRAKVARLLAREVAAGTYELEPGELRRIKARNKLREVFACRLTDLIVHGVVADALAEGVAPTLSPRVFSYRKGVAHLTPISGFASFLRAARTVQPDPRLRHMYVLRRDIRKYGDTVPLGSHSPLWSMLEEALGHPVPLLVDRVIRVQILRPDGGLVCRTHGLPMGQPIASVILNLYLRPLDRELEDVPRAFYARYGDDFLFAHADPNVAREAEATIDRVISRIGLTLNEEKRRDLYLTASGRRSDRWPGAEGSASVDFLGSRIGADGTIGLHKQKMRALLRDIKRRVAATASVMRDQPAEVLGPAACAVVNRTLDPGYGLAQHRSADLVRRVVTDRAQLRQIDYWIARIVAEAVSGRRGPAAFRTVPYRQLRREWKLMSVVAARNDRA